MNNNRYISTITIYFFSLLLSAQVITHECNALCENDSLLVQLVEYSDAGSEGENNIWDFSRNEVLDNYVMKYVKDSCNMEFPLKCIGNGYLYRYHDSKDTLFLSEIENNLLSIHYLKKPTLLHYPFQYGDEIVSPFWGEGRYCNRIYCHHWGTMRVNADATGSIILTEKDTVFNALRVYTLTTSVFRMNVDSCQKDSDNLLQEIREQFHWYVQGSRYPVFEVTTATLYYNETPQSTTHYSLRLLPRNQFTGYDAYNERLPQKDSIQVSPNELFTFFITSEKNQVTIHYDLAEKGNLHFLVTDILGMVYRNEKNTQEAGTGYEKYIDCNGLRHGHYIIYINVNGNIYSHKIEI